MADSLTLIQNLVRDKSSLKQDVYDNTLKHFEVFKSHLRDTIETIEHGVGSTDKRLKFGYIEKSDFEVHVQIAGDVLVFCMHTNVFQFDKGNSLWKSSYLKEDESRGFVGSIQVYNFLADSLRYQRPRDLGYLIARVFVNKEDHFLVQGKRQLGFLYNDFINGVLTSEKTKEVVHSALLYTLDFDLFTPPYEQQQQVSVGEMLQLSQNLNVATGKRLGFRFSQDQDA